MAQYLDYAPLVTKQQDNLTVPEHVLSFWPIIAGVMNSWSRLGATDIGREVSTEPASITRVHPRAAVLVATTSVLLALCGCTKDRPLPPQGSPNIIFISLDTLRADRLGCYGYERPTSPNLDAFASRATLFETAMSTAPKTPDSHMSMFTSLYQSVHGIGIVPDVDSADDPEFAVPALSSKIRTLAEILYERGYATVGYHAGGFMRPKFGFARGFEVYEEGKLTDATSWLEKNAERRPFFLFYHTYSVHDPYTPEPPYDAMFTGDYDGRIVHDRRRLKTLAGSKKWSTYTDLYWDLVDLEDPRDVAHLNALYDGGIAALDAALAPLFETIERRASDTIVVIVSDHGEEFGEHGAFTHTHLYRELLEVPLIIRTPGQINAARIERPVSLIDLAPTLLEMLGMAPLEQFQGRSLVPLLAPARDEKESTTGAKRIELFGSYNSHGMVTVRDDAWRLISTEEGFELYDIVADVNETDDLLRGSSATAPRVVAALARLKQSLERWQQANSVLQGRYSDETAPEILDEETIEQLRALGYLN